MGGLVLDDGFFFPPAVRVMPHPPPVTQPKPRPNPSRDPPKMINAPAQGCLWLMIVLRARSKFHNSARMRHCWKKLVVSCVKFQDAARDHAPEAVGRPKTSETSKSARERPKALGKHPKTTENIRKRPKKDRKHKKTTENTRKHPKTLSKRDEIPERSLISLIFHTITTDLSRKHRSFVKPAKM